MTNASEWQGGAGNEEGKEERNRLVQMEERHSTQRFQCVNRPGRSSVGPAGGGGRGRKEKLGDRAGGEGEGAPGGGDQVAKGLSCLPEHSIYLILGKATTSLVSWGKKRPGKITHTVPAPRSVPATGERLNSLLRNWTPPPAAPSPQLSLR